MRGAFEVFLRVDPGEVDHGDQRRGAHELRADQALHGERAQDLLASLDLDPWDAGRLAELFDAVLRVVPEADLIPESSVRFASLPPGGHGAYIEMEPLRNSVAEMCALMTTGFPDAASALASSSTESMRAGSSKRRPAAP